MMRLKEASVVVVEGKERRYWKKERAILELWRRRRRVWLMR